MFGVGEYNVAEPYKKYTVKRDEYYMMSLKQRQRKLAPFNSARPESSLLGQQDGHPSAFQAKIDAPERNRALDSLCKLSVTPEQSQIIFPAFSIVEKWFLDASSYIYCGNNIVSAPGSGNIPAFFVTNEQDPLKPFFVTATNSTLRCTEHCIKFAAYKICPHTIAVAEKIGELGNMLATFNRKILVLFLD